MKKIVLIPTKNDAWILEKSLPCILLWADSVIISNQSSTDNTLEICRKYSQVKVIHNAREFHSTKVRQELLDEARKTPGNNFIFCIDSDEFVTTDVLCQEFWDVVSSYQPGTCFEMQWVQLWRSALEYRDDNSVWSNSWKSFAFIDDRISGYTYDYAVNDHNPRVPTALLANKVRLEMPKILHYQFVNWERMLSKQRFYRVQDFLQNKTGFLSAFKINAMYNAGKLEEGIALKKVPEAWVNGYKEKGIDISQIKSIPPFWYDRIVVGWLKQFGTRRFRYLDIWDINWQELEKGSGTTLKLDDPRNIFIRFYHYNQATLYTIIRMAKQTMGFFKSP